ncbi:LPS-assembly protein LptD precursor [compost metagenome]
MTTFFSLALFAAIFSWTRYSEAQDISAKIQGILINADSLFRDSEKETVDLEGNVQIVYKGQHVKANKARIYLRSKQIEASGNVEILSDKHTIGGDAIQLDYESNTGLIYNGFVQSGSVLFQGSLLQKIGPEEFLVSDAEYTTCSNCPPSWSFSGSTVRAQLGGYAYIKNTVLRFGKVPFFWLPYLVVPLKSDRQTGLLTPGFEQSSKGGYAFGQPFFWAISDSTDATITLKNYELRGLKTMAEYRYALSENSFGQLDFAQLYDNVFGKDDRLNTFRNATDRDAPLNRWYIKYEHYYEMPEGYIHRAQVNLASDLQYPKDFPLETMNHGDSAMENRMSFTKNTKDQHYSVDSSYYVNLLQSNPLAGNENAVHRIPELRYAQSMQNVGSSNFLYLLDLDFNNFARAGQAYDDLTPIKTLPNGTKIRYLESNCPNNPNWDQDPNCYEVYDGSYNPSIDMIRAGQRLDFKPTLLYPIQVTDGFDFLPSLSYRETHYGFNVGEDRSAVRRYLRSSVTGRMIFSGIYGDKINSKATRYKHEITPEVTYTNIPWLDQTTHPFFGTGNQTEAPYTSRDSISDGDLGSAYGLQFDYYDRIYDRNLVTVAITNKVVEKRWVGDRPVYRQLASLKIAQSYDASQEKLNNGDPYSDISTTLDVRLDNFQTYSIFNYFPRQGVTNASSRVRVLNDRGQFAQVALTRQYKITPGQPVNQSDRTEDYTLSSGFTSRYVNLMGRLVFDANYSNESQDRVKSWAYIAQFKPPGDCMMITFIQDQITGGDTNWKLNFEFNFDGIPKPPLPPETLDQFGF